MELELVSTLVEKQSNCLKASFYLNENPAKYCEIWSITSAGWFPYWRSSYISIPSSKRAIVLF